MGWSNPKFKIRISKFIIIVSVAFFSVTSCPTVWATNEDGVETEDGPQTWPVPRGPAHDLVPYQYDSGILKSVPKEFLEDAPACILYSGVTNLVESDGTIETITHEITRLNSRKSLEKLGEYRNITYDPSFEKVTLNEARVLKADGRAVPIEPRHVQLRDQITDYLVYDRDKQLIISFPTLEVGDAIEVKWTVRGKNPEYRGHFFARYGFGDDRYPVVKDEMRVRLPKTRALKFSCVGGKVEPKVQEDGDWRTYLWQATNRRELPQDENLPSKEEYRLEVVCSTFTSWDEVLAWKNKLRGDCWICTPEVRQVIDQVTRDLKSPLEKARALTYWVRRNVRYVSSGEKHDFTPHPPTRVLANRFGDCKDQSQLLAVMLREIGIEVSLVTLATHGEGQILETVPSPLANHAILLAKIDGQEHWIDTTTTLAGWDFLVRDDRGRVCFVVDPPSLPGRVGRVNAPVVAPGSSLAPLASLPTGKLRLRRTPELTPEDNRIEQTTRLTITADGSSRSERTSTYCGLAAMIQRDDWLEVPSGERRRAVANELQNASNLAHLRHLHIDDKKLRDFDQPVTARIEFEVPNQFNDESEHEGSLSDSQVWARLLAVNLDYDRQTAMELGSPFESVHRFEITLCPIYRFETLPKERTINSKWGSFRIEVKSDEKDSRKLRVEFRTRLEKTRIDPADFETFRQFHEAIFKNYRVWLSLAPTSDIADARLLEDAWQKTPGDSALAVALARIFSIHDKKGDARRVIEKARQSNPNNPQLWELTVKTSETLKDQESTYSEMVKRFPQEPKYAVALGETRVNLGDQAGARAVLNPLTSNGEEKWRGQAHYQLARSCMKEHHYSEALKHLESAAELNSEGINSLAALELKGRLHEKLGQNAEAADAYRQSLLQDPDSEQVLSALIRLELATGQRTDALDLLRRLTVAAGDRKEPLIQAAKFHLQMNRWDDAFELACRADPIPSKVSRDSDVCRIKGLVYLHRQDYQEAVAQLKNAKADPTVLEGLIRAYLAMGNLAQAERQAERVDQISEATMPLFRAYASIILLEQRRLAVLQECPVPAGKSDAWNRAVDAFVCVERLYESGINVTERKGVASKTEDRGLKIEDRSTGDSSSILDPPSSAANPPAAPASDLEKLLEPAVQNGTEIGPAFALRGLLALERGRLSKAAEDAERAIRLTPKEARGYYVRGRVRLERNAPEALADLIKASELSRRLDPAILHWLAAAQFRAGQTDQAVATEQEAIKLRGDDPEFHEQLREFQKAGKK
jgi:tetratricopeptide (TPR) repeat protein/transglutaminase-like putative cysteine protease